MRCLVSPVQIKARNLLPGQEPGCIAGRSKILRTFGAERPTHVGLVHDLEGGTYFETEKTAAALRS